MEQFNITGLPVTLTTDSSVKLYPTSDGSFILSGQLSSSAPFNYFIYKILRTGDTFTYDSTIATAYTVNGSTYPRSSISATQKRGYMNGKPVVVYMRTTISSYNASTTVFTTTKDLIVVSLDGSGSVIDTISISHDYGNNSWPASNFDYCVNSERNSICYVKVTTVYEYKLDGTTPASAINVSTAMFQSGAAPIHYCGGGGVAIRAASGTGYVNRFLGTAPSDAQGGSTGNGELMGLELNGVVYKIVKGTGMTRTFSKAYSDAVLYTRTYTESAATFEPIEGTYFQFRSEGVYNGTLLFMRHINGAYLLTMETFDVMPSYNHSNIAAFPGNINPDNYTALIYGTDAYCYTVDVETGQPIVIRVPVGDYSQLVSQNKLFISPIIGDSVTQTTTELLDYFSRSTLNNELRFLTVHTSGTSGQQLPLRETTIRFTDDSLQRKQSSKVLSYGNYTFITESQKTGTLSNKLVPSIPYLGPRTDTASINPDMRNSSFNISVAGGTGLLANRTMTLTFPGESATSSVTVANVFPLTQAFICPYTGNLYTAYTSTSYLLLNYIDTTTWQLIRTMTVPGYPVLLRATAANQLVYVYGDVNAATPSKKVTIDTLNGTYTTAVAYVASDTTNYTYPLSSGANRPVALNFANGDAAVSRGIYTTAGQDNYALATRGNHVMDTLRQRRAFNQDWYYMRTMALIRTTSYVSTKKTSDYHALMPVSLHEGQPPTRWSLQQFNNDTAFLYESWPNMLKVTPFTLYVPEDSNFQGVPIPVEPSTTIKLRLYGWMNGG